MIKTWTEDRIVSKIPSRVKIVIFLLKMKNCLISTSAIDEHPNLVSILFFHVGKTPKNELKLGKKYVQIDARLPQKKIKNWKMNILFKNPRFCIKIFNSFIPALDHCGTITETQASSFEGLQILLGKKV